MAVLAGSGVRLELRDVSVRPVRGVAERRRWDALMSEFHYLPFKGLFGQSLRHVAECGGSWLALVGWTAGAFKVGVRDAWIGWPPERRFRRLKLIANNSRFALLCGKGEVRNLASRVLGLSLRRLSGEFGGRPGRAAGEANRVDPECGLAAGPERAKSDAAGAVGCGGMSHREERRRQPIERSRGSSIRAIPFLQHSARHSLYDSTFNITKPLRNCEPKCFVNAT